MTNPTAIPNDPGRIYSPSSAAIALATATVLIIFTWMFWSFLLRQVRFAIEFQADWGHTLVIPFIAGWFVWLNRDRILASPLRPSLTGLIFVLVGVCWFSVASIGPVLFRHHNLMGMGVGLTIFGLVLALCGWRAMKWMWFPVLYLIVFSQTVSDRFLEIVTFQLQGIATVGAEIGLSLLGYDVSREGHVIDIYHEGRLVPLNIAEACSGMRMLVAFLALGVAMAYRGLDTFWQRVVLVLMAVPTAIFVNILRVMTLGILSTMDSKFASGDFHSMVGLLWWVPAVFIYLGIMWGLKLLVLDGDEPDAESSPSAPRTLRFDRRIVGVFVACVALLAVAKVGFSYGAEALQVHLQSQPVPLRRSLSLIPSSLGSYQSVLDSQYDAATLEQLGTNSYISRVYVDQLGSTQRPLQFHVAYYTDQIDAVPHVPDRCMTASGMVQRSADPENVPLPGFGESWEGDGSHELDGQPYPLAKRVDVATGEEVVVRMPVGDRLVRHMEFQDPRHPERRVHAGYFFVANGRWKATPSGVKMAAFTGGDQHAYYCKVQVVANGDAGFDRDAFFSEIGPFLSQTLPEVMRSLPDWSEVTGSSETD